MTTDIRQRRCGLWLLTAVMLLSGASSLTYEILWQRQMFLIFGASAPATTAILTAIFLGIAFGSLLATPLARQVPSPVLLYAVLEAVMGGWGFLVPYGLQLADSLYVSSTHALGEGHALLAPLRFALAIVPLLPATLAMGATIPVMVRCVSQPGRSAVAWAYGVNILGAVLGSLLTGLVWLRVLGLDHTRFAAVGLNAVAFVLLVVVHRWRSGSDGLAGKEGPSTTDIAATQQDFPPDISPGACATMYFLAGFVALGLEVLWLRFLGIITSNSTATFTLTLTVYLFGMSVGSMVLYPLLRKKLAPKSVFTFANAATALSALVTLGTIYKAAEINHELISMPAAQGTLTLGDIYWTEARITFQLMLLPTLFMGLTYPAICDCISREGLSRDRWISTTYFWGTLGSVAGILLVGTTLIPVCNLHGTFALLLGLLAILCLFSQWQFQHRTRQEAGTRTGNVAVGAAVISIVIASAFVAHDPQPVLRNSIARKIGDSWFEVGVMPPHKRQLRLLRVKAGPSATVMVKQVLEEDVELVYVDDQLVASTNLEAKVDSLMLAHLPLLLHPDPKSALTVGFGTGRTSQSLTAHDIDAACVEIEPQVIASYHFIQKSGVPVTSHPKFRLILNDARDHLHAGHSTYDSIITDVTNLQYKQNGNLYTVEYFQLMRDKLNSGGIAAAWIPMAAIDISELRILMKSFQKVFPHATLWFMNHTHTNFGILIGTPEPLSIDFRRIAAGFDNPAISEDLKQIGMTEPLQLIHCLHLDEAGYRTFCGDSLLHTDNRPILEFSSPLSFYKYSETFYENLRETLKLRPDRFDRYVRNLPTGMEEELHRHEVASQSFCEVLLRFYRFNIEVPRGDFRKTVEPLNEAVEISRQGMAAWPDDTVREEFYVKFFGSAAKWVQNNAP